MKYLIDTNIVLEILLKQSRRESCKQFLQQHRGNLILSNFSLYSIGIHYFRIGKSNEFVKLIRKFSTEFEFQSLNFLRLVTASEGNKKFKLDFDDAYQYAMAKENGCAIVTIDKDFKRVNDIKVIFL